MRRTTLNNIIRMLSLLGIMTLAFFNTGAVWAADPTVKAVFFYSPSCGHCHAVMTEVFPDIEAKYGNQLEIMYLDTSKVANSAIFDAAIEMYEPEFVGVPFLVVSEKSMIGSVEIPEQFEAIIESYLAEGGVDWPDIPGLENAEPDNPTTTVRESITVRECFERDLVGNGLSVVVLVGLIITLYLVLTPQKWHLSLSEKTHPWWFIIVLVIGMIAAIYLTYVETTQTEAICGPVGDCNAVQQSEFALLFGFLPMALFGFLGYLAILAVWLYEHWIKGPYVKWAPGVRFALTLFGLAFSIGLTFLEPFVICATCAWCLTSAISMALLALFSAGPGWRSPLFPKPKRKY